MYTHFFKYFFFVLMMLVSVLSHGEKVEYTSDPWRKCKEKSSALSEEHKYSSLNITRNTCNSGENKGEVILTFEYIGGGSSKKSTAKYIFRNPEPKQEYTYSSKTSAYRACVRLWGSKGKQLTFDGKKTTFTDCSKVSGSGKRYFIHKYSPSTRCNHKYIYFKQTQPEEPENKAPSITLIQLNSPIFEGETLTAEAQAFDDKDKSSTLSESIRWYIYDLSLKPIATGATLKYNGDLSEGSWTLTAKVQDSGGRSASKNWQVQVKKPTLSFSLIQPIDGTASIYTHQTYSIKAKAIYDNNRNVSGDITWWKQDSNGVWNNTNKKGSTFVVSSQTGGRKLFKGRVEPDTGDPLEIQVSILVKDPKPKLKITNTGFAPTDTDIILSAEVSDDTDSNIGTKIKWYKNNNYIGTGNDFNLGTLDVGEYAISAEVTNSINHKATDATSFKVFKLDPKKI